MNKKDLTALFTLLGLSARDLPSGMGLDDLLSQSAPPADHLTDVSGRLTAAWYSVYAATVQCAVIDPLGNTCRFTYAHSAYGHSPSPGMLWDALCVELSGIAARMAVHGKMNPAVSGENLTMARSLAERIASISPLPNQPWDDTPAIGKFGIVSVYAERPSVRCRLPLERAYREARRLAGQRRERIEKLTAELEEKKLLVEDDFIRLLGPRTFTLER